MTKNKDDFDDDKDDVDQDKSYVGVADKRLTKGLRTSFYSTNSAPASPQDIPLLHGVNDMYCKYWYDSMDATKHMGVMVWVW